MGRNKLSIKKSWLEKKFKKNLTTALNVMYAKNEKIYPTYVSKNDSKPKKQVNLLMISSGEGWHYITVKK